MRSSVKFAQLKFAMLVTSDVLLAFLVLGSFCALYVSYGALYNISTLEFIRYTDILRCRRTTVGERIFAQSRELQVSET